MHEDRPIRLICKSINFTETEISTLSTTQAMGYFIPQIVRHPITSEHNIVIIHTTNQAAGRKMLEII
ncbi:MAG: hypothetical protein FWE74_08725 [Oscillospiraceae bacterium]|nr:hypothetical protein [Oscillospiraceae bacterium]